MKGYKQIRKFLTLIGLCFLPEVCFGAPSEESIQNDIYQIISIVSALPILAWIVSKLTIKVSPAIYYTPLILITMLGLIIGALSPSGDIAHYMFPISIPPLIAILIIVLVDKVFMKIFKSKK